VDVVVEETCNDGIQNQDETRIDCGGPCGPCFTIGVDKEELTEEITAESEGNIITGAAIGVVEKLRTNPVYLIIIVIIIVSGLVLSKYFRKEPPNLS